MPRERIRLSRAARRECIVQRRSHLPVDTCMNPFHSPLAIAAARMCTIHLATCRVCAEAQRLWVYVCAFIRLSTGMNPDNSGVYTYDDRRHSTAFGFHTSMIAAFEVRASCLSHVGVVVAMSNLKTNHSLTVRPEQQQQQQQQLQ